MTERLAILGGSVFEEQIGYARAVVDGDRVHVSGTTGFDYATMMMCGLSDPRMKIEIEVSARRGGGSRA
ncbi:hypothetical protein [Streptomyces sp. NPDC087859]|uniref:hypothetical protein n=1 Tax=Streptomyces sp. NPDC087859 TaxID=3365812 RepID=UPI00381C914E